MDAAVDDSVYVTGAVDQDDRWPEYGRRVHEEVGVCSVMAHRLVLLDDSDVVAALNIYSRDTDAFDDDAVRQGTLFATQCSLLVSTHLAADRSDNLTKALGSNREIGMAMGVLMARRHVTRDEAFAMLRRSSQDSNRKVTEVAADVVDTGELPHRKTDTETLERHRWLDHDRPGEWSLRRHHEAAARRNSWSGCRRVGSGPVRQAALPPPFGQGTIERGRWPCATSFTSAAPRVASSRLGLGGREPGSRRNGR